MDIREQICDVCRKMWHLGWVAANDGNISVKNSDKTWWITPSGLSKSLITPDKLIRVDRDMNIIEGPKDLKPSTEMKMHMRCYEERTDVNAVVHAHPPVSTGFAVANKPLDQYCMIETVLTVGSIPVAPYATPSTQEVPDSIAPFLQEHDVLLLQNHGALAVGTDLITAFYRMETLEHFAKISLVAHLLGGAKEISPSHIDKLLDLRKNYYHISGRHPGYKKYSEDE